MTPIDVHFVPLHKLATWLIYRIAPLNFDVALGVMCIFHLLGVWMLYRSLELIQPSRLNAPLAVLCGVNLYAGVLLLWWTAGIHRLPCILFSLAAIYNYLKFRQGRSTRRLLAIAFCELVASAFFSKGLLIPGILGALEFALFPETPRRDFVRNVTGIAVVSTVVVAYRVLSSPFMSDIFQSPPLQWHDQVIALQMASMILHQGFFGLLVSQPLSIGNWLVIGLWSSFFFATLFRDRFSVVVWILGLVTVAANFLAITLSPRMQMGPVLLTWERYYFEVMFIIVLFVALLLRRTLPSALTSGSGVARTTVAAAWCGVLLSAALSQQSFHRILESSRYEDLPFARAYVNNLKADLGEIRRTRSGLLAFAEGDVPARFLGVAVMTVGVQSQFLMLFDPAIRVFAEGKCLHVVQADGRIARPSDDCTHRPGIRRQAR